MSVQYFDANAAAPAGEERFIGWCLDKEDLCVAKPVAIREKDRNFVAALLEADLVDAHLIASRLRTIPSEQVAASETAHLARLALIRCCSETAEPPLAGEPSFPAGHDGHEGVLFDLDC